MGVLGGVSPYARLLHSIVLRLGLETLWLGNAFHLEVRSGIMQRPTRRRHNLGTVPRRQRPDITALDKVSLPKTTSP